MRYVIIGAGGIGGTIGALLFETGQDVVLVARGPHLESLRAEGLRFSTPTGTRVLQIPAVGGPQELDLRVDDVLVLCVKGQQSASTLQAWADRPVVGSSSGRNLQGGDPPAEGRVAADVLPLICAQNGVENERVALRRFARVYGICLMLPASHLEPGRVTASSHPVAGVLSVGRYPSGADELARRVGADLTRAGFLAPVVADLQRWKYAKLLRNLGNAIEALCGPVSQDPDALRLHDLATAEGATVLAAAGIDVAGPAEEAVYQGRITNLDVPGAPRGGGSSWQSLTRGAGSIESDYLNGEIVLLSRLHGVDAPVNAVLQRLADRAAATATRPGQTTAAAVLAELERAAGADF